MSKKTCVKCFTSAWALLEGGLCASCHGEVIKKPKPTGRSLKKGDRAKCLECNKKFTKRTTTHIRCSKTCSMKAASRAFALRNGKPLFTPTNEVCECGTPFVKTVHNKKRCSEACSSRAHSRTSFAKAKVKKQKEAERQEYERSINP